MDQGIGYDRSAWRGFFKSMLEALCPRMNPDIKKKLRYSTNLYYNGKNIEIKYF